MSGRRLGAERVLAKLRTSVQNGEYYEAHQMYRTLYFRYCGAERWEELYSLLLDGARLLLKNRQTESGADLATLYVDTLARSHHPCDQQTADNVSELYGAIDRESADRPDLLTRALDWSRDSCPEASGPGHPLLHRRIATVLWQEGDLSSARYHLLHSHDGEACAQLLIDLHTKMGHPDEIDLFVTQAVLQYLALKKAAEARVCFHVYLRQHPSITADRPPFSLPMFNFVHYLLEAVDSGSTEQFETLRQLYAPCLSRDPCFAGLLERVGAEHLGVAPPTRRRGGGLLDGLLQSLMSGLDDSVAAEGEGETASVASPAPKVAKLDMAEQLD